MTVSLSSPSPEAVTVDFATADGTALADSDYEFIASTVAFAPGVTSQTIRISVLNDASAEANETFNVILSKHPLTNYRT